jgi:hypothetical protein
MLFHVYVKEVIFNVLKTATGAKSPQQPTPGKAGEKTKSLCV